MIVIKTMDSLPEYCYECPCHNGEHGQCNADKERRYNFEYRPYWCPLESINKYERYKTPKDCLSCAQSFSADDNYGNMILICTKDAIEMLEERVKA